MSAVLPPLATAEDVTALGADPDTVTSAMLDTASARFRAEAHHPITPTCYRQVLNAYAGEIGVPVGPIRDVLSLRLLGKDGSPGDPLTGYGHDGQDRILLRGAALVTVPRYLTRGLPRRLWVEWEAGYEPVPDEVRWTVAGMAARAADIAAAPLTGATSLLAAHMAAAAMTMTAHERAVAHTYRPHMPRAAGGSW